MNTFELLTKDAFEALEVRQSHFAIERLESMLNRLDEMEQFLDDYLSHQPGIASNRNTSIPIR